MKDDYSSSSSEDSKTLAFFQRQQWFNGFYITSIAILLLTCLSLFFQNIRLLRNRHQSLTNNTTLPSSTQSITVQRQTSATSSTSVPAAPAPVVQTTLSASPVPLRQIQFIDSFPKHPLAVRGIQFYVLWQPSLPQPSSELQLPPSFLCRTLPLWTWSTTHIFQQPVPGDKAEPWLSAQVALDTIAQLLKEVDSFVSKTLAQPAYILVSVREFSTAGPRHSWNISKEYIEQELVSRQKNFVECLQDLARMHLPNTFRDPLAFEHYDRATQCSGWFTITPTWAILCGVSDAETRTLANIIQPQEISITQGGIDAQFYDEVLGRIVQWNSTQGFFEAINRLETLAKGGEISTRGQLWLNFSLAFIGILLSIVGIGTFGWPLVLAIVLLALASLLFAWYASKGSSFLLFLGGFCFLAALAVAVIFAPLWFPLLQPHPHK